jgi:hypothetical protein
MGIRERSHPGAADFSLFSLTPMSSLVYGEIDLPPGILHAEVGDAVIRNSRPLTLSLTRNTPMRKLASLFPAFEQPALPVRPARSRSLARPNC